MTPHIFTTGELVVYRGQMINVGGRVVHIDPVQDMVRVDWADGLTSSWKKGAIPPDVELERS